VTPGPLTGGPASLSHRCHTGNSESAGSHGPGPRLRATAASPANCQRITVTVAPGPPGPGRSGCPAPRGADAAAARAWALRLSKWHAEILELIMTIVCPGSHASAAAFKSFSQLCLRAAEQPALAVLATEAHQYVQSMTLKVTRSCRSSYLDSLAYIPYGP
jgi:hypothetical protein